MTPDEFAKARQALGLSRARMALMLGFDGTHAHAHVYRMETGERTIRAAQRRLIQAYLDGYRPEDWPAETETSKPGTEHA